MSLRPDYYYEAPGIEHYKRRHLIPEDKWCKQCEGMGLYRIRHSMIGRDWVICLTCYGTGRIAE